MTSMSLSNWTSKQSFFRRRHVRVGALLSLCTLLLLRLFTRAPSSDRSHPHQLTHSSILPPVFQALPAVKAHGQLLKRPSYLDGHSILEFFYVTGQLPSQPANDRLDMSLHRTIDGVWFWVNGSDPRHALSRAYYAEAPSHFYVVPPMRDEVKRRLGIDSTWHFDDRRINSYGYKHDWGNQEQVHHGITPDSDYTEQSPINKGQLQEKKGLQDTNSKLDSDANALLAGKESEGKLHQNNKGSQETNLDRKQTNEERGSTRHKLEKRSKQALQNTNNRFRDNGELKYSLRSAEMHFGPSLGTQHIVTTDFWPNGYPDPNPEVSHASLINSQEYSGVLQEWSETSNGEKEPGDLSFSPNITIEGGLIRRGQFPQWINTSAESISFGDNAKLGKSKLRIHHDWSMAIPLNAIKRGLLNNDSAASLLLKWKLTTLPTFNSMSAEAVLGINIPDLTETFFYSNDDMFFGNRMSASDFGSPLYGLVQRMNSDVLIMSEQNPEARLGEGPSLFFSNWLVSQRFGFRERSWFMHQQKSYSRPHILESRLVWPDEFDKSAARRFRGRGIAANSHFITYHYMIERHREALLWSFFILRQDKKGLGYYTDDDVHRTVAEMGGTSDNAGIVDVAVPRRSTLGQISDNLEYVNLDTPKSTRYLFSSMDGTAASRLPFDSPDEPWPDYNIQQKDRNVCVLDIDACWPAGERDPSAVFRRFAFERPEECGDCLIAHLIGTSGHRGMKRLLPEMDQLFPQQHAKSASDVKKAQTLASHSTPHLPIAQSYKSTNFSLASVLQQNGWQYDGGSRVDFATRMIHRYSYVIGDTPSFYWSLKTAENVKYGLDGLRELSHTHERPALICLNDDVAKGARGSNRIQDLLQDWYDETFAQQLPYETDYGNPMDAWI